MNNQIATPTRVAQVEKPRQLQNPLGLQLQEVDLLVKASQAREFFNVTGEGQAIAVLDTGLWNTHVDFVNRVVAQKNFTADNGGDSENAIDGNGHGTNVAGIAVAGGIHTGIAPGANLVPIKVLDNQGGGDFTSIKLALDWVVANAQTHDITTVCMSLGDSGNYQDDVSFGNDQIGALFATLRQMGISVVVAAGNDFFTHNSAQGMGYPAIFRDCISVGAVYDNNEGRISYQSGATAFSTAADRITPFSQRLHESENQNCRTDIFAPGAPVTSSGINNDHGESVQHGTSQATPVIAGVILLMRHFYQNCVDQGAVEAIPNEKLVDQIVDWLRVSGMQINDGDNEHDNVVNTNKDYIRVDALAALKAMRSHLIEDILNHPPS